MRNDAAEKPLNIRRYRCVAAEQPVVAEEPEIARPCNRVDWRLGNIVLVAGSDRLSVQPGKQAIKLALREAKQLQVDAVFLEAGQLGRQRRVVPAGIDRDLVVGDAEGAGLSVGQVIQPDDRNVGEAQLPRGKQAAMPGDEHTAFIDQARNVETELGDRASDLCDLIVRMGPGIGRIGQKPLYRPAFDLAKVRRHCRCLPRTPIRGPHRAPRQCPRSGARRSQA